MAMWRRPPTRTSMSAFGILAPIGPYQLAKCSGSVHIAQMRSRGATKTRSIWRSLAAVIVGAHSLVGAFGAVGRRSPCGRIGRPRCGGTARPTQPRRRAQRGGVCTDGTGHAGREYLCEMVSPEMVARAWRCAALNPDRQLPGLRWHLLNVALIAVNKSTASRTAHAAAGAGHRERQRARASELALYLPDRDLSDMKLRSLALSQFAWHGWSLRNLAGDGAEFHHCDFAGAQVDDTLNTARLIEPRGVPEVHAGAGLAGD
jgi:hypothetical protein